MPLHCPLSLRPLAAAVLACALNAYAQAPALSNSTRSFDLPAQPLGSALARIAADSGQQISIDAALVRGHTAPAVRGSYTAEQAAQAALQGSRLELVRTGSGNWTLRPAAPVAAQVPVAKAAATPASEATLPAVRVTAARVQESAYGPVGGIVARRSATATKTDTSLIETPQSVSVVTREQMEAQDADTLTKAFDYSAGIYSLGGGNVLSGTQFIVRGFNITGTQPLYLNGSKFPIGSLANPEETYLFERVELLKGPASILFGQAAPGGIINLVSKRPTAEPLRELQVQAGSFNRKQIAGDFSGALSADGAWTWRLTGLLRDSDTMVDRVPDDRASLAAALNWRASADTSVMLLATRLSNSSLYNSGLPVDGTVLPNPNGRIASNLFTGEPGVDKFEAQRATLGYLLEHRVNDGLKLRQNALWYDTETDYAYLSTARVTSLPLWYTATRSFTGRVDEERGFSLDTNLQADWTWGGAKHTLLAGLDFTRSKFARVQAAGTAPALNVFAPVYGAPVTIAAARTGSRSNDRQLGVYLQDQIKIDDRWIVLLGVRRDHAESRSQGISAAGVVTPGAEDTGATTYRAGVMHLFGNGLAPYLSYAESFQPQGGTDFAGRRFVPTSGKQHEAGIKYEPRGANASLTLAAYELTQQNVLTTDPVNAGFSVQTGEVRSRGFEFEGRVAVSQRLDVVAAYARTNPKVTRSNGADLGRTLVSAPRYTASLFADYRFGAGALEGWGLGGGVRRVGSSFNNDNTIQVPPFTVADLAVHYQLPQWQLSLNVRNVFDKQYYSGCIVRCFPGEERSFTLTAKYKW